VKFGNQPFVKASRRAHFTASQLVSAARTGKLQNVDWVDNQSLRDGDGKRLPLSASEIRVFGAREVAPGCR
jgi:hypothetical protein